MAERLGPYEIRGKLGEGAMAVVWRGWDPKLEREVAIKEPVRSPTMSEATAIQLAQRFVQEGKTAARLSHPGIVTIFAADVFDGRSAIVMELLRGHPLSALIDRGAIPGQAALSILDQLFDALDYAHTMGVVHRDVKPDNVFITDDGRVKLTDFGVAHVNRVGDVADTVVAGTPGYMSPEQIRAEPVDARSDVFSVGVVAYEMLAGTNPFGATEGVDTHTLMYRMTIGPEPTLAPVPGLPAAVATVVSRAISRDPLRRYQSVSEMQADMRAAAAGGHVESNETLADLVDEVGPAGVPGVSFASSTVGAIQERIPEKGSTPWVFAVAGIAALVAVVFLALGTGGDGVGLLLVVAAIGGAAWWWFSSRSGVIAGSGPRTEAEMLSMGVGGQGAEAVGPYADIGIRGPMEERETRIGLPCVLGRSTEAQLTLMDDMVSRRHAFLESRGEGVWVTDMGSRNGTYVDGIAVADGGALLPAGSVLLVGDTEIRLLA